MLSQQVVERLTHVAETAIASISVKSALNPALWFTAVVTPFCAVAGAVTSGNVQLAMIMLASAPVIIVSIAYVYFMLKEPDRLQSETFQLKKQALSMIEAKGQAFPLDVISVEAIANPDIRQLPGNVE